MTDDQKVELMATMIGCPCQGDVYDVYLELANEKILNRCYPYGIPEGQTRVDRKYEYLQIELAIYLYNQRGGEGQETHIENGVTRKWRTENEILQEIVPFAGVPNL